MGYGPKTKYEKQLTDLIDMTPERILERASKYHKENRILESSYDSENGIFEAIVMGRKKYKVRIDAKSRTRSCTCPAHKYYRDTPCKHEVLLCLEWVI